MGRDVARRGLRAPQPIQRIISERPRARSAYGNVQVLESTLHVRNQLLRDTERASVARGLEVRVPRLAPFLHRADQIGKNALATAAAVPLPSEIVVRPEASFDLPIGQWLRSATFATRLKSRALKISKVSAARRVFADDYVGSAL